MLVYRIGKSKWKNDLTGNGAKIYGGRWNNIGVACIYASGSRALAILEYSAHTSLENIPRSLSFTSYKIPDDKILVCSEVILPGNWKNLTHTQECKDFGSKLIGQHLVVQIPSVILPFENNFLINPNHPDFSKSISIVGVEDYSYDIRLKE